MAEQFHNYENVRLINEHAGDSELQRNQGTGGSLLVGDVLPQ